MGRPEVLTTVFIYLGSALVIGTLVGQAKGRAVAGMIWGLVLGPLGWVLVALGPNLKPKCSHCKGVIIPGATKCKNCGSDLLSAPGATGGSFEPPVRNQDRQ